MDIINVNGKNYSTLWYLLDEHYYIGDKFEEFAETDFEDYNPDLTRLYEFQTVLSSGHLRRYFTNFDDGYIVDPMQEQVKELYKEIDFESFYYEEYYLIENINDEYHEKGFLILKRLFPSLFLLPYQAKTEVASVVLCANDETGLSHINEYVKRMSKEDSSSEPTKREKA